MKKSELRKIIKEELVKEITLKGIESGSTDQEPPTQFNENILSRISDLLEISKILEKEHDHFKGLPQKIFELMPTDAKLEWNYSRWNYVP